MRLHMYDTGAGDPCTECCYQYAGEKIRPDCSTCPYQGSDQDQDQDEW